MNTALHVLGDVMSGVLIDPKAQQPNGTDGLWTIAGWVKFLAYFASAVALIGALVIMAINKRRGEAMEHTGAILSVLFVVVGIGAAFGLINALAR